MFYLTDKRKPNQRARDGQWGGKEKERKKEILSPVEGLQ
jgi:hypothetical protein